MAGSIELSSLCEKDRFPKRAVMIGSAAAVLSLCVSSCLSFRTPEYDISSKSDYAIHLKEVIVPSQFQGRCGEQRITSADSTGDRGSVFENQMIRITWVPTDIALAFTLENKTNDSLRILWHEADYMDVTGDWGEVTHGGVHYGDLGYKNWPQPPSVVGSKQSLSDLVLACKHVSIAGGDLAGTGHVRPLIPGEATSYFGQAIRVSLPLEVEGAVIEYTFVFVVDGLAADD